MNILKKILPSQNKFVRMLKAQAKKSVEACILFEKMLKHKNGKVEQIKEVEHQGDLMVHKMYEEVYNTFITPVDDIDLISLSSCLDDIIDSIYTTAKKISIYKVKPTEIVERQIKILHKSCSLLNETIGEKNLSKIKDKIIRIHKLEDEGDEVFYEGLVESSKDRKCLSVIEKREIYNELESAIDRVEDAADIILDITIKER